MFATTDPVRRGSVILGGLLLAALLSSADLAAPTAAAAQSIAPEKALLGHFEAGFEAGVTGSARERASGTDARIPSPEAALLGKAGAGQTEERIAEAGTGRRAFIIPVSGGGEQALLGRRGRAIS